MNFFPVSHSTLLPAAIAKFVNENYLLAVTISARILKTGINDTYLITADAQKFIFRVYHLNWRTEAEIEEEIRLLLLLKDKAIPVSFPIADRQSRFIQQLTAPEGMRYGVLFSFAQGEKMLNFSASLHYKAGCLMAGLHQVTQDLPLARVQYNQDILMVDSLKKLGRFLPAGTAEMKYMKALQGHLLELFNNAPAAGLRKGVVHLDIWFDNFVIDENDTITLFDFDFCGTGWLLFDVAYYILQLYSTEKDPDEFELKKASFLQGYQSITAISQEEQQLIPAAGAGIYFFYLGVQSERYDDWSNSFLNEIYLKRFINLLIKKWVNFHNMAIVAAN